MDANNNLHHRAAMGCGIVWGIGHAIGPDLPFVFWRFELEKSNKVNMKGHLRWVATVVW